MEGVYKLWTNRSLFTYRTSWPACFGQVVAVLKCPHCYSNAMLFRLGHSEADTQMAAHSSSILPVQAGSLIASEQLLHCMVSLSEWASCTAHWYSRFSSYFYCVSTSLTFQFLLTPTVSSNHSCFSSYRLLLRHCISLFFLNGDVVEQSRSKGGKLQWGISTLKVFVSHKTERKPLRSKCLTAIYPLLLCDLLNNIPVQFNDVPWASTTHPVFCLPRNWFSRGALL